MIAALALAGCSPGAIHEAASLPETLSTCDREWVLSSLPAATMATLEYQIGSTPAIVDPAAVTPCPPGACTAIPANGSCHTVIYARVGTDAYVGYELQGGP